MAKEQRTPVKVEGLSLGDEGQLNHFNALASREEAAAAAKDLEVGDAAFIKRSDLKWTYALLVEKDTDSNGIILRFDVDKEKNRKSFPEKQWGKYIRCINQEVADKPDAAVEEEETKASTEPAEADEKPAATGWFSGIFGSPAPSKQPEPAVSTNESLKESVEMPLEQAVKKDPTVEEEPVAEEASVEVEAPAAPVVEAPVAPVVEAPVAKEEEEEDKENDAPEAEEKKTSIFQKISFSRSASKHKNVEKPASKSKKEWFDPLASEVDYDKNPTDLFQALEARQWAYAGNMVGGDAEHFKKDCSTWVVAKGKKKGSALRFRALPLHAAVVFGAPENLTKVILDAYPLATKGRDVKGRLPLHLACEHDVSDEVLYLLIKAFPKAFYAKDKLEKTPLDYMKDDGNRKWLKQMIPVLIGAKVEEEKVKWDAEKEQALVDQREALKSDPEFTKVVSAAVEDATETKYANKFELIKLTHKKEIELLKKNHADETQALLEGFEVKLNFEKKLHKLKGKR